MTDRLAAIAVDAATGRRAEVYYDTPAWVASLEWARWHGLDPNRIARGEVIRDEAGCRILYVEFVLEGDQYMLRDGDLVTRAAVEQGEAPPLPWPEEVQRLMAPPV